MERDTTKSPAGQSNSKKDKQCKTLFSVTAQALAIRMLDTKRMIIVMQAFLDGHTIERASVDGVWEVDHLPQWDWVFYEYRIKHRPAI